MIKPILNALREVLKFKGHTTVAELAKLSGKKQIDVLSVLNRNEEYIIKDKNKGWILRFSDWYSREVNKVYESGKIYRSTLINYGAATVLETKNPKADVLRQTYHSGGFGDSYSTKEILDTPENREALKKMGIVDKETYHFPTLDQLWKE